MTDRAINSSFTAQRETIMFFLPIYLTEDQYGSEEQTAGNEAFFGEEGTFGREVRVMYLNPQRFDIAENKIINEQLTKGGYIVQYWGEQLPIITAGGTTGSSGIEGINILRDIYRHEQIHFRKVLEVRQREAASAFASNAAMSAAVEMQEVDGFTAVADLVTGGGYSDLVSGVENSIDILTDAWNGSTPASTSSFLTVPTLASFATSIDMYYQGEIYRGFFTTFSVNETAQSPGIFEYSFTFKVTRRTGVRQNFMPWHLDPTNADGKTKTATEPNVSTDDFGNDADNKSVETSELCFGTQAWDTSVRTESVGDTAASDDTPQGRSYDLDRGSTDSDGGL
jgi:hypothetical protein